ncbi:MAG TPA: hypothetical protein VMV10_09910 [Pirellulales bacterium]|nr:hypothetical protein [Pirellulales bacterium]
MRMLASCVVAIAAIGSMGAYFSTEDESTVMGALEALKYEHVPNQDNIGGPADFKVTEETIDYLESLRKDGKTVTVDSEGTVSTKDKDDGEGKEISKPQALVDAALKVLKLEQVKAKDAKVGGPSRFKVTNTTIDTAKKWLRQKTILVVEGSGKVRIGK